MLYNGPTLSALKLPLPVEDVDAQIIHSFLCPPDPSPQPKQHLDRFQTKRVQLLSTLAADVYFSKWPPPVGVAYTAASRLHFLAGQAARVGLLYVVYTVTILMLTHQFTIPFFVIGSLY